MWSNGEGDAFITGTNQWKLHTFYLNDAWFANRENGASDFRAAGRGNGPNDAKTPNVFNLHQNYPNPFNPTTKIEYQVAKTADITLNIYNLSGQLVQTLVNGKQGTGSYQVVWDKMPMVLKYLQVFIYIDLLLIIM